MRCIMQGRSALLLIRLGQIVAVMIGNPSTGTTQSAWVETMASRMARNAQGKKICPLRLAMRTPLFQLRDFAWYRKSKWEILMQSKLNGLLIHHFFEWINDENEENQILYWLNKFEKVLCDGKAYLEICNKLEIVKFKKNLTTYWATIFLFKFEFLNKFIYWIELMVFAGHFREEKNSSFVKNSSFSCHFLVCYRVESHLYAWILREKIMLWTGVLPEVVYTVQCANKKTRWVPWNGQGR